MTATTEGERVAPARGTSVITGGAGGMGLAAAKIIGRDHDVVICDLDERRLQAAATELQRLGIDCTPVVCDVTDRRSVEALAARAAERGRLSSLVHTAGLSPQMAPPEGIIKVNALGTVHVNEAFLPLAAAGFSVVNVASTAGHLPPGFPAPKKAYSQARTDPDRLLDKLVSRCRIAPEKFRRGMAYSLSKNFVIWYSRELAGALGEKDARIVSVSPGSFDTAMGRLEEAQGAGALASGSALRRFGAVDEIAEVLAFCASSKPGYLTGTDLLVDGGAKATMTMKDLLAMARNVS